jgi:signal transduction histidine kinase
MRQAIGIVGVVNLVLFAAIAGVCVRQWLRHRSLTALWAALAFVSLATVAGSGYLLPDEPGSPVEKVALRTAVVLLVLFPYLLYRFAAAFEPAKRPLARFVDLLTSTLVVATIALPSFPAEGESWPWWFVLYVLAFLVHWSVLLLLVAIRLWRAGRFEATVARRRMQMLALASTALAVTLLVSVGAGEDHSWFALTVGLLGTLSAVGFFLGFAPPAVLRLLWRRPEQSRMQLAIGELMGATTEHDAAARVLPPMAEMVGARGIVLEGPDGAVVAEHRTGADDSNGDVRRFEFPFGTIVVHTSAFAPFFGDEERKLLYALGSLTSLALDRSRLFAQERQAREALERADELKSEFVALAAHELRSPVSAIYGISETIAERRQQLTPDQLVELQTALTTQIRRLRELVEQLLDLSRLDAEAVTINPQRVRVRERLERIVHAVAPLDAARIGIEADATLEANVDVDALERIVSNLLVNACRYGEPPVVVRAAQNRGVLHVTVEDSGPGVPDEFVSQLFDRFARDASSAATVAGTGLGLAIARSYARAHHGEVSYRPAAPRGAAFELTLPVPLPA